MSGVGVIGGRTREAGMVYLTVLLLVALMSTAGFAFLFRAAAQRSVTRSGLASAQAQYLAESAANHAMWRLLNETNGTVETVSSQVTLDGDDAEEKDDGSMEFRNSLEMGKKAYVGVRFVNVTIPQGASITNARVEFTPDEYNDRRTDLTVFGEDADSTLGFSSTDYDISTRPRTAASVTWHAIPLWFRDWVYRTPDLSSIVEEIVDRPGWASGNSMVILFRSDDLAGERRAYSHDDTPSKAPSLHISYRAGEQVSDDVYYMHDLAGGRYGYKIRWDTDTTFATVATVGSIGDSVAEQSYVLHVKPPALGASSCPKNLLFLVDNALNLTPGEAARKTLMESWNATVTPISDSVSAPELEAAVAANDVIYVSQEITSHTLATKLRDAPIGLVNEEYQICDDLGLSSGTGSGFYFNMDLADNTHYITSEYSLGALALFNPPYYNIYTGGAMTLAPDLQVLGRCGTISAALAVLDAGGALLYSTPAPARRVQVPWGADFAELNTDGQILMMRAIEWAAGMENGCDDLCAGLIGYWELDETDGSTAARDSSGSGNDGTLHDMDPATDWVPGHMEGALDFDASDDTVLVSDSASLSLTGEITIAAWINNDTLSGYDAAVAKGRVNNYNYWFGTHDDEIEFAFALGGTWTEVETSGVDLQPHTWYHIAASYDNGLDELRMYRDGSQVFRGPMNGDMSTTTNSDYFYLGNIENDADSFDGTLDEVRLYNRVLGPGKIAQLHALTKGGCPGTAGDLLYVVRDASAPTTQETARQTLMEGWGFSVTLIDDDEPQAEFDSAAADNEVAYISQEALATAVGDKLNDASIGVVNENKDMIDDFGFAKGLSIGGGLPTLNTDPGHYITSPFGAGPVAPYAANEWYQIADEPVAPGVDPVGTWVEAPWAGKPALMALCPGDSLIAGGAAAGRRVQLPWGSGQGATPVDITNSISDDGRTMTQRAIEWASGLEGSCGAGGPLLLVVPDPSSLSAQDSAKKTLIESWGWTVTLIDDSDLQANFDAAVATVDVAYVSDEVVVTELMKKLKAKTIGVVNEDPELHSVFGFSSVRALDTDNPSLNTDGTHYITSPFGGGIVLALFAADQPIGAAAGTGGTAPSGPETIGTWASGTLSPLGGLLVLETGAVLWGGGTATGRRVQTPWGGDGFDPNMLTADGETIMKRAIEWAASTPSCDPDYTPDMKVGEFSTAAYGSLNITGITFLPEGKSFNGVAVPAGGAWISAYPGSPLSMTDMAGNLLSSCPWVTLNVQGVALVESGTWADHLAVVVTGAPPQVIYTGLDCNPGGAFSTSSFGALYPKGITFIDETLGGLYPEHLAILDTATDTIYIVDQAGNLKHSMDISHVTGTATGIVHLPGTDKFLVAEPTIDAVFIRLLDGSGLGHYFFSSHGADEAEAISLNPLTCDHVIGAAGSDVVVYLNVSGGGGGGCTGGTFRDEFGTQGSYAGNDGTLSWAGDWLEINETDGPTAGDEQVLNLPTGGVARLRDNDGKGEGLEREADLAGCATATLSFDYWRMAMSSTKDFVTVEVSADGGATWAVLHTIAGPATGDPLSSPPLTASFDISGYMAVDTRIRFVTSSFMGATEGIYIDNVQIEAGL